MLLAVEVRYMIREERLPKCGTHAEKGPRDGKTNTIVLVPAPKQKLLQKFA